MTAQEPDGGPPKAGTPRSRGIDYLGNLGRMLRDLTGFATLMFELLQNADDAGAASMRIDVGQDGLVVFNDAVFSDCGDQGLLPEACLYLEPRGHRCDFHSFRDVASGDKRGRADTTGAFGIGFTAVYQVADTVTLISAGRRWDIDELQPETSRIIETPAPDARGTTFVLPWARDPESEFRRRTGSAAVGPDDPQRLLDVLASDLPTAMLFLRHVREVEVARAGQGSFRYRREDADDMCEITGGSQPSLWLMLRGDFDQQAMTLRSKYPGKIEDRRRAEVTIAIPLDSDADGLLCAYMPTDERSGLPAHVNADFYPESDRKHLITDSFHGEWNRLAVRAAARILADRLPSLAPRLGHERLWQLLFAAHGAKPAGPDTGLAAYWEEIGPLLPELAVMWTTTGQWVTPGSTVFLYSSEEDEVIPVLEDLGVLVMHPEAGAYARRMTGRAGARQLTAGILADALLDSGLSEITPLDAAPAAVAASKSRELLWRELERLLSRATPPDREVLRHVAVLPGTDSRLWPAGLLQRADAHTARLMADLGLGMTFLDEDALPEGCAQLAGLCPVLGSRAALTLLASEEGAARLAAALDEGRVTAESFLSWLRRDEQAILADAHLRAQVRELPVYPAAGKHRPLTEVVLPGGFTDRLGIAEAIDGEQVSEHITFLRQLGATPLTLRTYLTEAVPRAAQRPEMLSDPRWEQLIADMAARLDTFAEDAEVRQALTPLPLVACRNGAVMPASSCYFANETVTSVLGTHAPTALPLAGHERSTASLYEWLGVAAEPRLPDVVARVQRLAAGPQDLQARQAVAAIVRYLGKLVPDRRTPVPEALTLLQDLAWLPPRGDHTWRQPAEVHTIFNETLFATQGRFLDLPLKIQQDAANFLHWLGVEANPSVSQVVDHLITMASQRAPVGRDVYLFLNRNADDPAVGRLANQACLLLSDGEYARPGAVFRQDNPFGRFRRLLGPDFDAIGSLLDRLGVKRLPDHHDARDVLTEISGEEDRRFHVPVDDEDDLAVIWRCWRMLDEALAAGEVDAAWFTPLRNLPVIPNDAGILAPPTRLLVDDMPGVAAALNIGDAIIRRKEGMWRAFRAAGVRSLTQAVTIEILRMRETTRDGAVRARMQDRRPALARILDEDADGIQRLAAALRELSFPESPALRVRYHLPDFQLSSAETSLNALYVPADVADNRAAQLICCPADGAWPWMVIAKEFARALYPGETPGPLASSLYVALSAPSLDAADSALDDAGWPRLEHVDIAAPATTPGAGFMDYNLGADEPDRDQAGGTGDTTSDAEVPARPGPRAPTADSAHSAGPSDEDAGHSSSGAGSEPTLGIDEQAQPPSGQPGQPRDRTPAAFEPANRVRHRVPHGRLRSYVATGSDENDAPADGVRPGQAPVDTSPVDQAGVRRVVDHERAAGRYPEVMPHENPGFDVISRDGIGRVLRHIEVKSVSSAWDDTGVGLTRTQFEFARQHQDTFWLYVVEYAVDDQRARVLRIADPAGRADEFRFDDGWSAVSEDAES